MLNENCSDTFKYRILVIDDQRSQLKLMKSLLSKYGCSVVTMDSSEEAEQIILWGEHFNLIITDLKMPWLNGLQFCKRIKARHPDVLIYALSGNIEAFDEDELKNSGFDAIFQKPITRETIKQILVSAP